MMFSFAGLFSGKVAPPKEEPLRQKEKKATLLPFTGFFSNLLVSPKEKPVKPREGEAMALLFTGFSCATQGGDRRAEGKEGHAVGVHGFFGDLLTPPKEEKVTPKQEKAATLPISGKLVWTKEQTGDSPTPSKDEPVAK